MWRAAVHLTAKQRPYVRNDKASLNQRPPEQNYCEVGRPRRTAANRAATLAKLIRTQLPDVRPYVQQRAHGISYYVRRADVDAPANGRQGMD